MAYGPGHGYAYPPLPPSPPHAQPPRHAPLGVHIVAVLQYLSGTVLLVLAAVIGVVAFNDGLVGGRELPASVRAAVTGAGPAIAVLLIVAGLLALLLGRRLHRGRQWARVVVLAVSGASLGVNGWSLVRTGLADPLSGLVLPALYLVLLNTRPARAWFARRGY